MFQKFIVGIVLSFLLCTTARAGVVIKVRAINPLNVETVAPIKYPLPKEITPDDIIAKRMRFSGKRPEEGGEGGDRENNAGTTDFKITYDKKEKYYYVDHDVTLAPKEIVTLEVEVKDVWSIQEKEIEDLRKEVEGGESAESETAIALQEEIFKALDQIAASQAQNTVAKVGVEKHIKAYGKNMDMFRQAKMDVKMLKKLIKRAKKSKNPKP